MRYYKKNKNWTKKYRKGKSTYNKRKFRKTYNKNYQNTKYLYIDEPFPPSIKTRQNWSRASTILAQGTANQQMVIEALRLSSAHDPAISIGGSQEAVQYHNVYSRYYDYYTASYATITIKLRNVGEIDMRVACAIADNQNTASEMITTAVNQDEIEMQKYTQSRLLEADQGSRYNRGTMSFKFNLNTWAKRNKVDPSAHSSQVALDPNTYPLFYIAYVNDQPQLAGSSPGQIVADIKMTLWNRYHERQQASLMKAQ